MAIQSANDDESVEMILNAEDEDVILTVVQLTVCQLVCESLHHPL